MKSRFKKAASALSVVFTALLAIAALSAFLTRAPSGSLPGLLGFSPLIVVSGSMSPAVEAGDLIVVRERDAYRPGDVVTYHKNGSLVTHRLLRLENGMAVTKGDANNVEDTPFPAGGILGSTLLRVPYLGSLALFLRSRQGVLLLLCLGILLLVGSYSLLGTKRDAAEKTEEHA